MKCPVCREPDLVMSDRQGIEIDYCPQCRGVWLDRGELDKIIDRAAVTEAPAQAAPSRAAPPPPPPPQYRDDRGYPPQHHDPRYAYGRDGHYRKKKNFLGELFDFD